MPLKHSDLPDDLRKIVSPQSDLTGLELIEIEDVHCLRFDTRADAERAWSNGSLKCSLAELPAELSRLASSQSIHFKRAELKHELDMWGDHAILAQGSRVHIAEMDRPFLITDGKVRGSFEADGAIQNCSHQAVNGGAPGDYILVSDSDKSRVARVAREWVKHNIKILS